MALFNINYGSDVMNKYMAMKVIIPEDYDDVSGLKDNQGRWAVLYLLHGYTDDYTKWGRLTAIERYANEKGIAVVMPDAGKSFYCDMVHGDPYFTYITEEVPGHIKKWFSLSDDPDYTFIAGLSMGGYGALKIALTYPERYKAAASLSGVLAMAETALAPLPEDAEPWLKRLYLDLPFCFGDLTAIKGSQHDLFRLASDGAEKNTALPDLYISCGTEDFIYNNTVAFAAHMDQLKLPYKYYEGPGAHEWGYWDQEIGKFINWITEF